MECWFTTNHQKSRSLLRALTRDDGTLKQIKLRRAAFILTVTFKSCIRFSSAAQSNSDTQRETGRYAAHTFITQMVRK